MSMSIKEVKIRKKMNRGEVNTLISKWLLLEDEFYMGNKYRHKWKCKCGESFARTWDNIRMKENFHCGCLNYEEQEKYYKNEVEKIKDYKYIRSFRRYEKLPNGKTVDSQVFIQIKHTYCGNTYETPASSFIKSRKRCGQCCQSYKHSFAHYIEQELKLNINDVWDFEKNTVNPYHISKNRNAKSKGGEDWRVWIKCQEKEYHESYLISCNSFIQATKNGKYGCPLCHPTGKNRIIHLYDSFGYNYFDRAQSWSVNNKISPFKVSSNNGSKYKFICPKCKNEFERVMSSVKRIGVLCKRCSSSSGESKIANFLDFNSVSYVYDEPYFKDLTGLGGGILRPDFILPDHKVWIEYDGEFHFKKMYENDGFNVLQVHDKLKDEYAKKHGWKLIRIPYWEFDNIEDILREKLSIK